MCSLNRAFTKHPFISLGCVALFVIGSMFILMFVSYSIFASPNELFSEKLDNTIIAPPLTVLSYDSRGMRIEDITIGLECRFRETEIPARIIIDSNLSSKKAWMPISYFHETSNYTALSWIRIVTHYFECDVVFSEGNIVLFYSKEDKKSEKFGVLPP